MRRLRGIRSLARAEEGTILALFGMSLTVFLGLVALSFDLGRINITQTEMQSYVDHVALAAAGELDGGADSITRATQAANTLVSDFQTFAQGGQTLGPTDFTLTFHETLPGSDSSAMSAPTTDPAEAIYARVTANTKTVDLTFGAAFLALRGGGTGPDNTVEASAVAGFTAFACDVTPLMFCLPSPNYKADANIGNMVLLRSGGQGVSWGPGNFGFLDPGKLKVDGEGPCGGLTGGNLDRCLLAAIGSVTQCFSQRGVDTEPGQKVGIEDAAFNVRFDIYRATMNGVRNDPLYAPAPNVIKGIIPGGGGGNGNGGGGGQCIGGNEQASPDTVGLPRDNCFGTGSCARFGDGDWSVGRANYVNVNYGGTDPHPGASTRYQYYLAEIAAAGGGASNTRILAPGLSETGRPQCSNQQASDPDRRVVIAAGVDCVANPISGAATDVPVKEFFKIFLTEPVGKDANSPPTLDLWGEIVGSAGGSGGGGIAGSTFHDVIQLYR